MHMRMRMPGLGESGVNPQPSPHSHTQLEIRMHVRGEREMAGRCPTAHHSRSVMIKCRSTCAPCAVAHGTAPRRSTRTLPATINRPPHLRARGA